MFFDVEDNQSAGRKNPRRTRNIQDGTSIQREIELGLDIFEFHLTYEIVFVGMRTHTGRG